MDEYKAQIAQKEVVPSNLKTIKEIISEIIDINGGTIEKLTLVNHEPSPSDVADNSPMVITGTLANIFELLTDVRKQVSTISKETNNLIGN